MSQTVQPPAFIIPPPQSPLVGADGKITAQWWRYLQSLFISIGGGTSTVTMTDLQSLVVALEQAQALLYQPSGPDLHNIASIAQARQFASWGM